MGCRSEVSIIVGKKIDKQIRAMAKRFAKANLDKNDLDTFKSFLFNRTVSSCGTLVRYYHAYIKWDTNGSPCFNPCLASLEALVKKYVGNLKPGYEASFIRIDSKVREEVSNIDAQRIGIVMPGEFLNTDEVDCAIDNISKQIGQLTLQLQQLRKIRKGKA